jgi:hypothetical protein
MSASLFQLEISHGYFASGQLEGWTLAPDPATQAILARYGLVPAMRDGAFALTTFNPDPAGLVRYLDAQLAGAPLVFWLGCDQPQLLTVTDLPLDWAGQLALSSKDCTRDAGGWRMAAVPGPRSAGRDGVAGVLSVYLDDLLAMGGKDIRFTVDLAARPVHWVYYLVNRGQTRLQNPAIGKNGFLFEGPQPAALPGGEKAICFNSGETTFPLKQRPSVLFDLMDRPASMQEDSAGDTEYCVLKGLPVPDGKQLQVRNGGPDPYVYCAMHVYL